MFLLLDRLVVILLVGILVAGLAFLGTKFFITPKYQSETSIFVMNKNDEATVNASDYAVSNYMTQDYATLITSRSVMEQVIANLGLDYSVGTLTGMISVENVTDTRIIKIIVTDTDAEKAREIADAVREASATKIKEVMGIEEVNVVDNANLSSSPVSPNVFKNMVIGGILGVILAIAVIVIRHITDDTIKTPDEIERYLGISTLASIPVMSEAEWDGAKKNSHTKKTAKKPAAKSKAKSTGR
jgi:capsular polysaccharide biosynthesis protein